MDPRIADAIVVFLGHPPLITAVARVAVGARVMCPVHDAAQIGDEAAQDDLRLNFVAGIDTSKKTIRPRPSNLASTYEPA